MSDDRSGQSGLWKTFLDFLWDGGYRSTIVFAVTLGAIVITMNSGSFYYVDSGGVSQQADVKSSSADRVAAGQGQQAAASQQPAVIAAQPNPICAKYFELAFMVIGGYLGLSQPKTTRTSPQAGQASPSDAASSPVIVQSSVDGALPRQAVTQQSDPSVADAPATAGMRDTRLPPADNPDTPAAAVPPIG